MRRSKMERIGWCMAVKAGKRFMVVPSTTRTNRGDAIDYYIGSEAYKRLKRCGQAKTVAVYADSSDLRS